MTEQLKRWIVYRSEDSNDGTNELVSTHDDFELAVRDAKEEVHRFYKLYGVKDDVDEAELDKYIRFWSFDCTSWEIQKNKDESAWVCITNKDIWTEGAEGPADESSGRREWEDEQLTAEQL
jgi:hypothetical protein